MKQIKKIAISMLIGLIALLGFSTIANAYYVGQDVMISFNEYTSNGNIYCVEHRTGFTLCQLLLYYFTS